MLSSVFNIYVNKVEPDYLNIWYSGNRSYLSGSGFGIVIQAKKYILTNSHVVEYSNYIECIKYNSDKKFTLKIYDDAPEIDLALLTVNDNIYDEFWEEVPILKIVSPSNRGEPIHVVGFPLGGLNPSITKGIISRIIPFLYNYSVLNLAIQVDSAINPGNSGGPVFNDNNEIIGVAFAHNIKGQNMCYIIPSFFITHYIQSIIKFKSFPGICNLDIITSNLENTCINEYYLNEKKSGILVTKINPVGSVGHLLKCNDIIHSIDSIPINSEQTVLIENYKIVSIPSEYTEKIPYWHILRLKHPGDLVKLVITRNKKEKIIEFKIGPMAKELIPSLINDISRKYYIFAGLIFIPINYWYLIKINEQNNSIKRNISFKYLELYPESSDEEIVFISGILESKKTSGYYLDNLRLIKIDDTIITNLTQVYNLCENSKNKFIKFEFENNQIIILDTTDSKEISESLSRYYLNISYHNFTK
jgi:S1-C subfamily serine protease